MCVLFDMGFAGLGFMVWACRPLANTRDHGHSSSDLT